MKRQNITACCKNAVGTVFLLAGAFFVCSTFLSMRAVFADPIAPVDTGALNTPQASRAGTATSRTSRATSRNNASRTSVARTATNTGQSRAATTRNVVSRAGTTVAANTSASRATTSRNVVSRTGTASRATANNSRTVRARTATTAATSAANNARVSLQGSAIRGSKVSVNTNSNYTYLSSKLYTGNYSNIIDSTTGLISNDAFQNCMESYYTCMDEICTARNSAQRRCACAGRVKAFAEAETALESANEELIKVSGELALLIANKGKDVSDAFKLTDAEKVMNCVSWQDVTNQYGANSTEAIEWCNNHGFYGSNGAKLTTCAKPSYCSKSGNSFEFDIADIDGSSSDILASLQSWANAKEQTLTIFNNDNDSLTSAFTNLSNTVSQMAGISGALTNSQDLKDSLAETWGYELFEYAHNNVCSRVLDSCFNGIYEACGTPPSTGRKCTNGASQCPYNYNSYISVSNTGTYELNFITSNNGYTASNSATCFGYTSTSGDPYSSLRGPVADARRSIMQKYALDANADCDAYGEQLRATAQNIGYQKVAAQQALQQKRLEFAQEEIQTIASDYRAAISNFNECLSELYDCYTTQEQSNNTWSTSRIKTYCAQVANVPHCYEEMVCGAPNHKLEAVITTDAKDSKGNVLACTNSEEFANNTCRNVVTLSEILSGTYAQGAVDGSSTQMREACLQNIDINGVRNWKANDSTDRTNWSGDSTAD
ncbi:MAG: hypothetical protein NC311_04175 [Muribaculaceae bacterium]|nr:hypothetical protein [Muribaculaceae bacterium]